MDQEHAALTRRRVVTLGATAVGVVTAGCGVPQGEGEEGGEGGGEGGEEGGEGSEGGGEEGGEEEGDLRRARGR